MSNDVAIKDMSVDDLRKHFMRECSSKIENIKSKSIDYVDCLVFEFKEGDERFIPIKDIRSMNQSRLDSFIKSVNGAKKFIP